jgi:eukaryotic-like serine/threonine-protein kinase
MGREDLTPQGPAGPTDETVAGRYRLERSLGNGGMGEVFVATDTVLDRRVALKRLSSALTEDEAARARFLREARALARISSPNVVAVFDAGDDTEPYLVMELIEGTTLSTVLRTTGSLPLERARAIGAGIAAGLAAAHEQGVIHRDVKPSNIFLTASDEPKVGDFGIARLERGDMTLTMTGQAFGSAAYVSPEQATGGRVDARSDLYSLGCVLYEMLAGRRPFEGDEPVALTYQHVHTEPVPLDALDVGIAPELASLVDALLAKDPADRPQTADEVRAALEATPADATAVETVPLDERDHTAVLPRRAETLGERRMPPWWIFVAAAAVLLLLLVLAANALTSDPPGRAQRSPTAQGSSVSASPSPSPSATPAVPLTPSEAGAALVTLAQQMEASKAIDKHLADEVEKTVSDVLEHLDEGSESLDKLDELKGKIGDDLDHGKISTDDARQLTAAIDRFERALPGGSGEGD